MLTQILDAKILSQRELVYPYIITQKSNTGTKAELVNKGLESEKKKDDQSMKISAQKKSNAKSEPMSGLSK